MKPILRRITAFLLCAAILAPTALASDALGSRIYGYTLDICDRTTLTKEVMWSASRQDLRTENYVTYTPSASVSPVVSYGSSVLAKQSVYSMAKELESEGDRVLSGINGDYFVMATGDPLGLVVTDGLLRSSSSYLHAIGFYEDGSALIGHPDLRIRADFKGYSLKVSDINKIRSSGGYYLFTEDFGSTTKNTQPGVDVILRPVTRNPGQTVTGADGISLTASMDLAIGTMVSCVVEEVIEAEGATSIPAGKFILSINNSANEWLQEMVRSLEPGDSLDLEVYSPDSRWSQVESAVGAMYYIVSNGQVVSGLDAASAAPRTAVGIKANGDVIFYTIDGRQSGHSVGATIQMVAQRLQELGCTEAVLLDGGGSTSLVSTYPDYGSSSLVNKPSEGTSRAVTNAIFLVSNLNPTGKAASLYVTPSSLTLLPGATTQCVATAMDSGWYPMQTLPGAVTWSAQGGTVTDSGLFTAPAKTGTYTVTASSGGVTGTTRIQVYDTPDSIMITNAATGKNVSSLTLTPGQAVDLNAAASYRTIGLTGGDTCFTWTADPNLGTITEEGIFTAGDLSSSGKIKVAAGNYAVTISVTVNAPGQYTLLSDFEQDTFFTSSSAKLTLNSSQVQLGRQSLRVSDTLNSELTARVPLEEFHRYLGLWVCGDQSGNQLTARFQDASGKEVTQILTTLNFTGWKYVTAAIPADATSFLGLTITGDRNGTICLDQVVLGSQQSRDTQPPKVYLSVSGNSAKATLTDNSKDALSQDSISLTVDGKKVPFSYSNGVLTASLSDLGTSTHQITVTASDPWGNLGRDSVTVAGNSSSHPFTDMKSHWAEGYTVRLNQLGIITGMTEGGVTNFAPNRSITRGDFALMAARWLGLDLADYAQVKLPYADTATIPTWDLNAVKALYDLGIMTGSKDTNGTLRANAKASITRSEAMTILGRMLEKGYGQADLSGFSDQGKVPTWARTHVATLVELGVVNGSGGQLRPDASVTRAEVAKMLMTLW
ncbi:MAG: phosphodiester glycosidase family protein [Ruminiclostridium sp.]|nr:phosphodiester glycosidase family protein [Ruminiclostridium sp.]